MAYVAAETVDTLVRLVREQSTELARVRVELAGLRAEVRALAQAEADDDQAELIEAAHAAYAGQTFVAMDLITAAAGNNAAGIRLTAMVVGKSARSVGRMLHAARDRRTARGLVLRRVGDCSAGAIWCVGE